MKIEIWWSFYKWWARFHYMRVVTASRNTHDLLIGPFSISFIFNGGYINVPKYYKYDPCSRNTQL